MISRYEVTLNGIALSSVHPDILILDVNYAAPGYERETFTSAKRHGARIHRLYKGQASVTISFAVRAYDIRTRQQIVQEICKWAKNGGDLQINDRPGQKLVCVCEALPAVSSVQKWTDTLYMTFTAYNLPYWQATKAVALEMTGTSESGTLFIPGSAPETMVEATITANAALSSISLTVGDTTLQLTGLSISAESTIVISYDADMIQSIKTGTTSLLSKRSGADDLIAACGETNTFSFVSSASCTVEFRARGCWE